MDQPIHADSLLLQSSTILTHWVMELHWQYWTMELTGQAMINFSRPSCQIKCGSTQVMKEWGFGWGWLRCQILGKYGEEFQEPFRQAPTSWPFKTVRRFTISVYNVTSIEGKKFFVLSQANGLGGRNLFLSIMYFIVGGICFVLAITFLILKCIKNKNQVPLNVYW